MILQVFSVYDSKAKAYLQPFHAANAAIACRMISDAANEPQHMFNRHAADYTLQQLATFDDETGDFVTNPQGPLNIAPLLTFVQTQGALNG